MLLEREARGGAQGEYFSERAMGENVVRSVMGVATEYLSFSSSNDVVTLPLLCCTLSLLYQYQKEPSRVPPKPGSASPRNYPKTKDVDNAVPGQTCRGQETI